MRSDWQDCTLGDAVTLKRGYDLPAKERRTGTVPIVSSSGFSGLHSESMVKGPGVVTGRYGTIGQVFYVEHDFWPLNTTLYVQDFKGNDRRFVSYMLRTLDFHQFSDKAAVPGVNRNHLHTARIVLPPVPQQVRIASLLQSFDDRIDLLHKTNATLESIAHALFKSWFIDFDPVRAKAEGREPEGMDASTAALFPAEFAESARGLIPKGWSVSSLAEQCAVQIGGVWGEEAHTDKASVKVSCLRGIDAVELAQGDLPTPPVRWVSPKQIESRRLRKGDILIEGSGSFCGRSLLWVDGYKELMAFTPTYSNFVKRVSAPSGPHFARWIQRHLNGMYQSGEVKNYRTGSAFPNLDLSGMLGVFRVMPPAELLLQFDALMGSFEALKVGQIQQAASLAALRDTLLPRLISGKLRLPEAESAIEGVA